jgi:hypothetical protein
MVLIKRKGVIMSDVQQARLAELERLREVAERMAKELNFTVRRNPEKERNFLRCLDDSEEAESRPNG